MTESTHPTIIEVAVPLYLDRTYTYLVPEPLRENVRAGMRVLVPFGRRTLTGYVLGRGEAGGGELKEILQVLDREPLVTATELEFLRWTAAYYHHPLGEVLKAALPSGINVTGRKRVVTSEDGSQVAGEVLTGGRNVRTETFYAADPAAEAPAGMRKGREIVQLLQARGELPATELRRNLGATSQQLKRLVELGLLHSEEREVYRDPFREEVFERDEPLALNPHQAAALARLAAAVDARHFAPFLLFGVTGSGKTEVYLQAISHALEKGRRALVLVPEIALTPQLVRRFKRRFSRGIAVLHSALSDGERYDEWRRIRRGEPWPDDLRVVEVRSVRGAETILLVEDEDAVRALEDVDVPEARGGDVYRHRDERHNPYSNKRNRQQHEDHVDRVVGFSPRHGADSKLRHCFGQQHDGNHPTSFGIDQHYHDVCQLG